MAQQQQKALNDNIDEIFNNNRLSVIVKNMMIEMIELKQEIQKPSAPIQPEIDQKEADKHSSNSDIDELFKSQELSNLIKNMMKEMMPTQHSNRVKRHHTKEESYSDKYVNPFMDPKEYKIRRKGKNAPESKEDNESTVKPLKIIKDEHPVEDTKRHSKFETILTHPSFKSNLSNLIKEIAEEYPMENDEDLETIKVETKTASRLTIPMNVNVHTVKSTTQTAESNTPMGDSLTSQNLNNLVDEVMDMDGFKTIRFSEGTGSPLMRASETKEDFDVIGSDANDEQGDEKLEMLMSKGNCIDTDDTKTLLLIGGAVVVVLALFVTLRK